MESRFKKATELQELARSFRKKGDALRKAGRGENASGAYRDGLAALVEALELLRRDDESLRSMSPPASGDSADALRELIEIYGALGGMHERLGALDRSVASYAEGARLEERFGQTSTYNRLNALKYSLLTKTDPLRSYEPMIKALAEFIDSSLRADKTLSDRGWAWADLGDCLALLDRTVDARKAYATFIAKAEIKSPERTLDVLEKIATKLRSNGDEDAPRLAKAIDALRAGLVAR
jgi:tetratricopeptide (TPR) repeat protein